MLKSNCIRYKKPSYQTEYFYVDPDDGDVFKHVSNRSGTALHPRNQDAIDYIAHASEKHNCVWDIGANIGVMGVHLMKYFKHVVCFEPHPLIFQALVKTMSSEKNKVEGHSFSCMQVGVGDKPGVLHMQNYGASQLRRMLKPEEVGKKVSVEVPVTTGDSVLLKEPAPDFVKIDVESYEWFVLQGMKKTIEIHRPSFMIEIEDHKFHFWNKTANDVFDFFHARDYVAQDKWGRTWQNRDSKTLWVSERRRGVRDFFFVPKERVNTIASDDHRKKVKRILQSVDKEQNELFDF